MPRSSGLVAERSMVSRSSGGPNTGNTYGVALAPQPRGKTSASALSSAFEGLERASPREFRVVDHPARSGTGTRARRIPRVVDAAAQTGKQGSRSALVQDTGYRQCELGNRRVEASAVFGHHLIAASHGPDRRRDRRAARVLEAFPGFEQRLRPHHAQTAYLLHLVAAVGDDPVARK